MSDSVTVVQYWAGCPLSANSKWRRFLAIAQKCQECGWRTCLVWSKMPDDPALAEPFREAGCEIVSQARSKGNFDWASVWRTYRLLRRTRCDVFHCYNDHTSPLLAASLARVPVRIWSKLAMSSFYEQNVRPTGIHRLFLSSKLSCALATRVLARSNAVKKELISHGASPDRIAITPVDVDTSTYRDVSAPGLRRQLGYSPSDLIITSVGHAVPVKGWDVLLSSFMSVAQEHDRARLLLVGAIPSGDETAFAGTLQGMAEREGVRGRVSFLGHRSDIADILSISDIFVLPSRSEGQPGALVEAMAAGRPCIGTRVGGIPEVIEDERYGLLVDRDDADALAHALSTLLGSRRTRETMGAEAQHASERFDISTSTESLFQLYDNLRSQAMGFASC